jgi:hypothetical protein
VRSSAMPGVWLKSSFPLHVVLRKILD